MSTQVTLPRHSAEPPPPPVPVIPPRASALRRRMRRLDMRVSPYLFVAPFFVLFAVFGLYPLLYTAYLSTHKWTLIGGDKGSVGFANYERVFSDPKFWNALGNTVGLLVVATVPQLVLAILLASWLSRQLRARTAWRMGVLVPNITSVAAIGIVFGLIFAERYGLVNWLLNSVGVQPIAWRQQRWSSWVAISAMVDWRWVGYNALIYLAAMQAIPRDLYESAAIDGASSLRRFWGITLPLIKPTVLFTVIISTIGGLQLFTEPVLFDYGRVQGGSLNEFQTVSMYIYQTTFTNNFRIGYGAAISWTLFMIIVVFSLANFLLVRRSMRGADR